MATLPQPPDLHTLLIRTDYTDDATWAHVRAAVAEPQGEFRAFVLFVDDPRYDGLTTERLMQLAPGTPEVGFAFLADRETLEHSEHPLLVVDLSLEPGRTFRVVPAWTWAVQANLYLANADWEDFADALDADGVFRGNM